MESYRCSLVVSSLRGCTKSSTVSSLRMSSTRLWKDPAATVNGKLDSEFCLGNWVVRFCTFWAREVDFNVCLITGPLLSILQGDIDADALDGDA